MDVILSIKEYGGAGSLAMNLSLSNGLYLSPNAFDGFPVANSIMWLRSKMASCELRVAGLAGASCRGVAGKRSLKPEAKPGCGLRVADYGLLDAGFWMLNLIFLSRKIRFRCVLSRSFSWTCP